MADIRVVWDPEALAGDWLLTGNLLDTSREIVTAVAVSLFTHRTAEADDTLPHFASDRRGWWGDLDAAEIRGATPIGSRLWLLSREKQTEATRLRADEYIREALAWMTDIGLADAVDVDVAWFAPERLGAEITIVRGPFGRVAVRFDSLWSEIAPSVSAADGAPVSAPRQTFAAEFAEEFE